MIKAFYFLLAFFLISTFGYSQIHYKPSKFAIGITGTHYSVNKSEQIRFLYTDEVQDYVGKSFVNVYGVGLKAQLKIKKWISIGAEFSYNQNEVSDSINKPFTQKVTTIDFGGFAKIYPIQALDGTKRQKFMFYIPLRLFYSLQTTTLNYETQITQLDMSYGFADVTREFKYNGLSYSIVGVGVDFYAGTKFIINAEVTDDFEFADTRRFSLGLFYRF